MDGMTGRPLRRPIRKMPEGPVRVVRHERPTRLSPPLYRLRLWCGGKHPVHRRWPAAGRGGKTARLAGGLVIDSIHLQRALGRTRLLSRTCQIMSALIHEEEGRTWEGMSVTRRRPPLRLPSARPAPLVVHAQMSSASGAPQLANNATTRMERAGMHFGFTGSFYRAGLLSCPPGEVPTPSRSIRPGVDTAKAVG